jgi:hypothetical protein
MAAVMAPHPELPMDKHTEFWNMALAGTQAPMAKIPLVNADGYEYAADEFAKIASDLMALIFRLQAQLATDREDIKMQRSHLCASSTAQTTAASTPQVLSKEPVEASPPQNAAFTQALAEFKEQEEQKQRLKLQEQNEDEEPYSSLPEACMAAIMAAAQPAFPNSAECNTQGTKVDLASNGSTVDEAEEEHSPEETQSMCSGSDIQQNQPSVLECVDDSSTCGKLSTCGSENGEAGSRRGSRQEVAKWGALPRFRWSDEPEEDIDSIMAAAEFIACADTDTAPAVHPWRAKKSPAELAAAESQTTALADLKRSLGGVWMGNHQDTYQICFDDWTCRQWDSAGRLKGGRPFKLHYDPANGTITWGSKYTLFLTEFKSSPQTVSWYRANERRPAYTWRIQSGDNSSEAAAESPRRGKQVAATPRRARGAVAEYR